MEYGLLILRVTVGLLVAWRGRERFGRRGSARLSELGYRAPAAMALLAGIGEVVGGLMLALGFLTPIAAFVIAVVALNRIAVRLGRERAEAPVLILAVVVALAATGPGRLSIDRALGWEAELSGLAWAGLVLGAAAVTAFFTITLGRARAESMEVPA